MARHAKSRFVAVALVWASAVVLAAPGCAAVLGVDASDYADGAEVICACGDGSESCKGAIQDGLEGTDDLEATLLDCLDGAPACPELAVCLGSSDYAGTLGEACFETVVKGQARVFLRCAEGLECDATRNKCVTPAACIGEGGTCKTDDQCCEGTCRNNGTCRAL